MNIAATIRNGNQLGLQHCQQPHQQMVGPTTAAVPRYRAAGGTGETLFNNYVYSGIGGLVIDVDDKDLDCTTNTDFVYGKTYGQSARHGKTAFELRFNINSNKTLVHDVIVRGVDSIAGKISRVYAGLTGFPRVPTNGVSLHTARKLFIYLLTYLLT